MKANISGGAREAVRIAYIGKILLLSGAVLLAFLLASPLPSPEIIKIRTGPEGIDEGDSLHLPPGSGVLQIRIKAKHAESIALWLMHVEAGAEEEKLLLSENSDGTDSLAFDFPYEKDEGFSYKLTVEAKRGGLYHKKSFYIHHALGL